MLESGVDVNLRSRGEETCLMLASRANATESVDMLISRGAQTDAQNRDGDTALHYVLFGIEYWKKERKSLSKSRIKRYQKVITALVVAGCDPDIESDYHGSARKHVLWDEILEMKYFNLQKG